MTKFRQFVQKIEWSNFLFLTLTPLAAIFGTLWVLSHDGGHPFTWMLALLMMIASGLSVTVGYHRLFSHKTFQATGIIKLFCLLFGGAAFEGSAQEWCSAHRKHHQFVDTEKDPYNIKKGFWHAHMFWVVLKSDQSDDSNIKDLKRDPLILFQNRYYVSLAILVGFILPAGLTALWGDFWGGVFIAGFLRVVVNHHLTFLINSYCHYFGKQTYSDDHTARDSGFISLFTYGEGYHSFHHTFESDYRNGVRFYQWDPSKWTIQLLALLGLASRLKRAAPEKILEKRLSIEAKRLRQKRTYGQRYPLAATLSKF